MNLSQPFFQWAEQAHPEWNGDFRTLDCTQFPGLSALETACKTRINADLSPEELEGFLLCMAIDNEDEEILDACKRFGSPAFLHRLLSAGVVHPLPDVRWQMAELLRYAPSAKAKFLPQLLSDVDEYVRKRATNIS